MCELFLILLKIAILIITPIYSKVLSSFPDVVDAIYTGAESV